MSTKADIEHAKDIDRLVRYFYQQVLTDPVIGFFFTDIADIDLEQHLPKISRFWQKQLLGDHRYRGRTFEIHLQLHHRAALTRHHFHRWLYLFCQSVDALFEGPRADLAKQRAGTIAHAMEQGLHNREREQQLMVRERRGLQFFDPATDANRA